MKYILTFLCAFLASNLAFADTQARISSDFAKAITSDIFIKNRQIDGETDGKVIYRIKYNTDTANLLSPFGSVSNIDGFIGLSAYGQIDGEYVAFAEAAQADLPFQTRDWIVGNKATKSLMKDGDFIATFDPVWGIYQGHIAIVGQVESDGFWVIDQNWGKKGKIALHFIDKIGNSVGNINNYYIVRYG